MDKCYADRLTHSLRAMVALVNATATMLEEESPALAEVGYWSRDQRDAFMLACDLSDTHE